MVSHISMPNNAYESVMDCMLTKQTSEHIDVPGILVGVKATNIRGLPRQ